MASLVTVPFRGDTLFALREGETIRVVLKPIADRLGLDWSSQHKRTKRDVILSEGMVMMTMPSPGGAQDAVTLSLDLLPGWLFGINASRVKSEARELVLAYQRECHAVLYRHFFAPQPSTPNAFPPGAMSLPIAGTRAQLVAEGRRIYGNLGAHELWTNLIQPGMGDASPTGGLAISLFGDVRDTWCRRVVATLISASEGLDDRRLAIRAKVSSGELSGIIGRLQAENLVQRFSVRGKTFYRMPDQVT